MTKINPLNQYLALKRLINRHLAGRIGLARKLLLNSLSWFVLF
jgi:hypothetical protein